MRSTRRRYQAGPDGAVVERIPDVAQRTAHRADVQWEELPDGRIAIEKRKFGAAASKLLSAFKVPPTLTLKLDSLGSEAWKLMDGQRTVGQVAEALMAAHPDQEDVPARLGQYLSTLVSNDLVRLD